MNVLRVCYKHGIRFDERYYTSTHLPLAGAILGPYGVTSVEMVKLTAGGDGSAPPYQVMFSAYFASEEALQNALQSPRLGEVMADIGNFYDGAPDVLLGEVVPLPAPV